MKQTEHSFLVEQRTRGRQGNPEIAAFAGGFVVAWTDDPDPPCEVGGPDVRAKLFDAEGAAIRGDCIVNGETINHQFGAKVADLRDGGFVVLWQDFSGRGGDPCSGGIKAKVFAANGSAVGTEFLVNLKTAGRQLRPAVASLTNGGFVVAWQDHGGMRGHVRARVFTPKGVPTGDEFLVGTQVEGHHCSLSVAGLSNGRFVVTWCNFGNEDPQSGNIRAKVFDSDGRTQCEEVVIGTTTLKDHNALTVTATKGGFVVAWSDLGRLENTRRLKARAFDGEAGALGDEFVVLEEAANQRVSLRMLPLADGFAVAWRENASATDRSASIRLRFFDHGGTASGVELLVDLGSVYADGSFAAAVVSEGTVLLTWEDRNPSPGVSLRAKLVKLATATRRFHQVGSATRAHQLSV